MTVFTDLGVELSGNGYMLKFWYSGYAPVISVLSEPFRVESPVSQVAQFLKENFVLTVRAGEAFQGPEVELLGKSGARLANTVQAVTVSISLDSDLGAWQDWTFAKNT
jgi:hypothetical protein